MDLLVILGYGSAATLALIVIAVVFSSDGNTPKQSDGRRWKAAGWAFLMVSAFAFFAGASYGTSVGGVNNIGLLQDRELIFTGAFFFMVVGVICVATGALLAQSSSPIDPQ